MDATGRDMMARPRNGPHVGLGRAGASGLLLRASEFMEFGLRMCSCLVRVLLYDMSCHHAVYSGEVPVPCEMRSDACDE